MVAEPNVKPIQSIGDEPVERKLTVIFAADVAGYSRLMAASEESTLRALKAHREFIDDRISEHRGRIVGSAGDSVLAEFASPVEAVHCALEIQNELASRNADLPVHRRMEFRIGINLGDVIVDGPQIYGDGVNVAARLEGLADAGGIFVSGSVFEQVKGKLPYHFENHGRQKVKNIPDKVLVFAVLPEGYHSAIRRFWHHQRRFTVIAASTIVAVALAGIAGVTLLSGEQRTSVYERAKGISMASRVAVAKSFRDCRECPELIAISPGTFSMGSRDDEAGRETSEGPRHVVKIDRRFAIGRYEVTFAQWDACFEDAGCSHRPKDRGWGRGNRPVIYVSWDDTKEYLTWLSRKTGNTYRLPTEAEWEFAARGNSTSAYWWGDEIGQGLALCVGCGKGDGKITVPIGSFLPNQFGLHDVHGNVWEWTEDCWNGSYAGAPTDGSAWTLGECAKHVVRGGAWGLQPSELRAARRAGDVSGLRSGKRGFRIVRDLPKIE